MAQLTWTSKRTAIAYCYDETELQEALTEAGLTATPLPDMPVEVRLPSGLTLRARSEFLGGAMDEEGSDRFVVTIR